MALGGRPKEDGGHRPRKVSFDKATNDKLNKIKKNKISRFIEDNIRPVLDKLDPDEGSLTMWK